MTKREQLAKFFMSCAAIAPDGQITIKDKKTIVCHSDTSGVSLGYVESNKIDAPDGVYGVDFNRVSSFLSSVKDSDGTFEIFPKESRIILKFGKTKRSIPTLSTSVIRPIRPRITTTIPFTCKVEVDTTEFNDIISVIDKGFDIQPNSVLKIEIGYDGKELYVKTMEDPVNYTEKSFEVISVEAGKGGTFKSLYPFEFLREFSKIFKKIDSDTVSIAFGSDLPILLSMKDDDVSVEYLLAQIVEQE